MSDQVRGALIAFALLCPARLLPAQSVAEYRREVDSLGREWHAAVAVKVESDSAQLKMLPGDSVRVGHLLALTEPAHEAVARDVLARLAPEVDSAYGNSARYLAERPFVLRSSSTSNSARVVATGIADSTGIVRLMSLDFNEAAPLTNSWRHKIDEIMTGTVGAEFSKWLRAPIPTETPSADTWTDARIQLVLANSVVAQRCVRGSVDACLKAFSLVPVDDPAFTFYDETQQRDILQHNGYLLRRSNPDAYDRCMEKRDQTACASLLRTIPPDAIPLPVPSSLRQSLVQYALMVGGSGAFDRLAAANGSPADRLQSAAKMPLDSLVRGWRTTIMQTRSNGNALDFGTAIASIAWAGLFAGLSLRSSRWR